MQLLTTSGGAVCSGLDMVSEGISLRRERRALRMTHADVGQCFGLRAHGKSHCAPATLSPQRYSLYSEPWILKMKRSWI